MENETEIEIIPLDALAEDLERFVKAKEGIDREISNRDQLTLQLLDRRANEWAILFD